MVVAGVMAVLAVPGFMLVNMDVRTIIAGMLMPDRDTETRRLTRVRKHQVRRTGSSKYSGPTAPDFAGYFHGLREGSLDGQLGVQLVIEPDLNKPSTIPI